MIIACDAFAKLHCDADFLQDKVACDAAATNIPQALAVPQHAQDALEPLVHLYLAELQDVFIHHEKATCR